MLCAVTVNVASGLPVGRNLMCSLSGRSNRILTIDSPLHKMIYVDFLWNIIWLLLATVERKIPRCSTFKHVVVESFLPQFYGIIFTDNCSVSIPYSIWWLHETIATQTVIFTLQVKNCSETSNADIMEYFKEPMPHANQFLAVTTTMDQDDLESRTILR